MRGWQDQPRKMVEIKQNIRSLGCGLQVGDGGAENDLLAIRQSSNTLLSAARTSNARCFGLSVV
jgi:hypothetical protein